MVRRLRGVLEPGGEPFVIWWCNNEHEGLAFSFARDKTHVVEYRGQLGDGVMGFTGKCLRNTEVVAASAAEE